LNGHLAAGALDRLFVAISSASPPPSGSTVLHFVPTPMLTRFVSAARPSRPARSRSRLTSPYQFEVGLTNLLLGALGLMSGWFDRDFWLATIVAFTIYMLGAVAGHVRSMIQERNFAPGNAGYIFWYDVLVPLMLIALYAWSG
jgi:hypothetical protein